MIDFKGRATITAWELIWRIAGKASEPAQPIDWEKLKTNWDKANPPPDPDIEEARKAVCQALAAGIGNLQGQLAEHRRLEATKTLHERVPPEFFLVEHRTITDNNWATIDGELSLEFWTWNGPNYGDLRLNEQSVRDILQSRFVQALWSKGDALQIPEHASQTNNDVHTSISINAQTKSERHRGGRPQRGDWENFDKEVTRSLALDGGYLTRTSFRRLMKEWATQNMNPAPDERTVVRRLDKLVSDKVFASD
jgi:hypothetical protein